MPATRPSGTAPRRSCFPRSFCDAGTTRPFAQLIGGEEKFFAFRTAAAAGKKVRLRERIGQLETEIHGLEAQQVAKVKELEWIAKELEGVREPGRSRWSSFPASRRSSAMPRRSEGERGRLVATIAETRGKITETELEIIQVDQDIRSEVGKELAEIAENCPSSWSDGSRPRTN